jgi:polysaccharide biosynthesis/export protein
VSIILFKKTFTFFIFTLLLFSCGNNKRIVYFNNSEGKTLDSLSPYYYSPIYQINDKLSIQVTSSDIEAVKPFNINSNYYENKNNRDYNNNSLGYDQNNGYIIDKNGEIDFPLVGKIKIAGLNRSQTIDLLKSKLSTYVSDSQINIRMTNFSFTVLGDVRSPNNYIVNSEQVTILEAIGKAGDLSFTAKRKNILIIRNENGKREEIRLDLTSKNIHEMEGYYLRQNDVIYVQPNTAASSSVFLRSFANIALSTISLLTTLILLFSN